MPITALDPKTALVVIDLQKGIVSQPTVHSSEGVVRNAAALADGFRRHELPVALVNVAGLPPGRTEQPRRITDFPDGWTDLVPELNRQESDHAITKHTPGAFTRTALEETLRKLGVTQVVLTGISTSVGVEVTGRQAFELGFNVTFAVDAVTDRDNEAHDWSVKRVFPRIGECGTTQDIITLLDQRA